MKANEICKVLKVARLFEPDRNEEKWTNKHVYWEKKDAKLFKKRTNNIEVKTQSFPQRKQTNLGLLRKLCH